jgi:hypothetical protein
MKAQDQTIQGDEGYPWHFVSHDSQYSTLEDYGIEIKNSACRVVDFKSCEHCDLYLLKNPETGKYLRGAYFYKWTKSWRRAAVLSKSFMEFIKHRYGIDSELVHISDAINKGK